MPMYVGGNEILSAYANVGNKICFGYVDGDHVYSCDDPVEFQYYRIYIYENNNPDPLDFTQIQEIELTTTLGGADFTSPGMPTDASSELPNRESEHIIDNIFVDPVETWASADGVSVPHWVWIDAQNLHDLAELRMFPINTSDAFEQSARDFDLEGSINGIDWYLIAEFRGVTDWAKGTNKVFNMISTTFDMYQYRNNVAIQKEALIP